MPGANHPDTWSEPSSATLLSVVARAAGPHLDIPDHSSPGGVQAPPVPTSVAHEYFVYDRKYSLVGKNIGYVRKNFLKSQRRSTAVDTVLDYLAHLGDAFLLAQVPRFDLRGRKLLQVNHKYYLGDIGLRNGIVGHRDNDIGGVLENLVFLELRRRGYTVTVGIAGEREIDFVAERRGERWYVQVAYLLESPATIDRELAAFAAIRDAWPRVLLSLDPHQPDAFEGVRHQSLTGFLRGAPLGARNGDDG